MLYITIIAKYPVRLIVLYLFFNKIQKNKLMMISENSTIEVTDHEHLNREVLDELQQGEDHNLFAVKGGKRDMLQ